MSELNPVRSDNVCSLNFILSNLQAITGHECYCHVCQFYDSMFLSCGEAIMNVIGITCVLLCSQCPYYLQPCLYSRLGMSCLKKAKISKVLSSTVDVERDDEDLVRASKPLRLPTFFQTLN